MILARLMKGEVLARLLLWRQKMEEEGATRDKLERIIATIPMEVLTQQS